jgi:hypothetical protein
MDTVFVAYEYRHENLPIIIGIGTDYEAAIKIIMELFNKYKIKATEIQLGKFKDNNRIFGNIHYWVTETKINELFKDA